MKRTLLASLIFLLATGCSQQWRDGDSGRTPEEVNTMLAEASASAGSSFTSINDGAWVYFADTSGPMGNVATVLALDNLDFLNPGKDLWYGNIRDARVFFLDNYTSGGHKAMLIVGIDQAGSGTYTYYSMNGDGTVDGGVYTAVLKGSSGNTVTLRSKDVAGDSLLDVIQLKVYQTDSTGAEVEIGKFSTLIGYGP